MGQFPENILTRSAIFVRVYPDLGTGIFACDKKQT